MAKHTLKIFKDFYNMFIFFVTLCMKALIVNFQDFLGFNAVAEH